MNNLSLILSIRLAVLIMGGITTIYGGIIGYKWTLGKPSASMTHFIKIMSLSVFLLGTVMFLIGVGNVLEIMGVEWAYAMTVAAGLAGIIGVYLFLIGIRKITNFVVVK